MKFKVGDKVWAKIWLDGSEAKVSGTVRYVHKKKEWGYRVQLDFNSIDSWYSFGEEDLSPIPTPVDIFKDLINEI